MADSRAHQAKVNVWLTVILSVIGVSLFTMIMCPGLPHHLRGTPRMASSLSNVRQLAVATLMYWEDYDGHYPPAFSTNDELKASLWYYTKNEQIFTSPRKDPDQAVYLGNGRVAGIHFESIKVPYGAIILFESRDWAEHDGRNVAFADTHATFIKGYDDRMLETGFIQEEELKRD